MIDLHFHSKHSDGRLSVKEIANRIIKADLKYCSLTDHDTVDGLKEMKQLLEKTDIKFIPGVEMTALYNGNIIHVLVYDFDINKATEILKERNRIVDQKRIKELKTSVELFEKEGFIVSDDLKPVFKQTIGLMVALDVYNKKENQDLMIKKHGHVLSKEEFYNLYQAKGGCCYAPRSGVDINWVIKKFAPLTKNIILAHPFVPIGLTTNSLKKENIVELVDLGITGIEVYHDKNTVEQINFLENFVAENNLFYTGGSDSHFTEESMSLGYYTNKDQVPSFKLAGISYKIWN